MHDLPNRGYEDWSDEQLVLYFQQSGDPEPFGVIFVRHRRSVFLVILHFVHDPAVAEDLLQDCFERAFRCIHQYESGSLSGWLKTIAAHLAFNHRKRAYVRQETGMPVDEGRILLRHQQHPPAGTGILEVLEQLESPMQKACLKLFYIEGMECKEIAQFLGITPQAVKSHIQNGKRQLRRRWLAAAAESGGHE